jgi:Ca-activated chloride channel family protein
VGDGDDLAGRTNDLVGLITFAGYADTKVPLTLDHATVTDVLQETETPNTLQKQRRYRELQEDAARAERQRDERRQRELQSQMTLMEEEDGTAIGDAIALGVEKLRDLDRRRNLIDAKKIESRIMVLLTDGRNNKGDIPPEKAAQIAAAFDIRIYTIGAGRAGRAPMPQLDMLGRAVLSAVEVDIDEDTLKAVADITGGQYFRATDTESLAEIYAQIDKLERVEIEEERFSQKRELALSAIPLGRFELPSLLLSAFCLLGLEVLLANSIYRKVP